MLLKRLLKIVVYANLWVALGVMSLTASTGIFINQWQPKLLVFCGAATLLVYAYARWFESPSRTDGTKSVLSQWLENHRSFYLAAAAIGAIGVLFFSFSLQRNSIFVLMICGIISAIYPLHLITKKKIALRNVAGLKLFAIALVWTVVTAILPLTEAHIVWQKSHFALVAARLLFVLAITIPFDIRDLRIDSPEINTLPYLLGVRRSRQMAQICLALSALISLGFFAEKSFWAAHLLSLAVASIFVAGSRPSRPDFYFSFGVESVSIITLIFTYFFSQFWP